MNVPLWITIAFLASLATIIARFVLSALTDNSEQRAVRFLVGVLALIAAVAFGGIYKGGELQLASSAGMVVLGFLGIYQFGKLVK